jgi:hypothetical protein
LRRLPYRARRGAVGRRTADAERLRHHLCHQYHARPRRRHRPLERGRFLARAARRRQAGRAAALSGNALHLVSRHDPGRCRCDLRVFDADAAHEGGEPQDRPEFSFQYPPRHGRLESAVPARQPSCGVGGELAGVAARPLSGERARTLRRMPYPTRHRGRDGAVALVHRLRPRAGRRARHHARGARGARLDELRR